jgi:RNA polymerase sigma-70 factor (ECF subfamily)
MCDATQRRARPVDFASRRAPSATAGDAPPDATVVQPFPGCHASRVGDDPADQAVTSEAIQGAFAVALLHLAPQQRSVLVLRDVLRWRATEVAELLGTTEASVNSTLQRARSNLAARRDAAADQPGSLDEGQRPLLDRYVDAFRRYDVDALVSSLL